MSENYRKREEMRDRCFADMNNRKGSGRSIFQKEIIKLNDDRIGNVIRDPDYGNKEQLYCFKCQECNTIFTIRSKKKLEPWYVIAHVYLYAKCPGCGITRDWNWSSFRITKTRYKFIRAWRDLKERFNKEVNENASESEDGTVGTGR